MFFQNDIAIDQLWSVESGIFAKIISNFLKKYFSDGQIFVSIVFPSLEKEKHHFLQDLFANLFNDPTMEMFACNFLNKLDNSTHENRRTFNLILVDDSESLK